VVLTQQLVENEEHEGKRKAESVWPIFRLHHQRSRYIFEMYYKKKAISRELYEFCLQEKYADASLIAKWKKVCVTYIIKLAVINRSSRRDMNDCVACVAFKLEITTLVPPAFAGFRRLSLMKERLLNAFIVDAEVALAATKNILYNL